MQPLVATAIIMLILTICLSMQSVLGQAPITIQSMPYVAQKNLLSWVQESQRLGLRIQFLLCLK